MRLIPTILCGGAGSRLWPISRESHPKPFIRMTDGKSLLQKTFLRASLLPNVHEILTVTNRELFFKTEDEFREVNKDKLSTSYILEPFGRNTAAAICIAALQIAATQGKDALVMILPADHLIEDAVGFVTAVNEAIILAQQHNIVTFGITPTTPETGYGYIESNGNQVIQFVEKPSLEKAQEYLQTGNFLWNSGMFCFEVETFLQEMAQHCEPILSSAEACLNHSRLAQGEGFTEWELEAESFSKIPENSIDYALIEHSSRVAVVPCNIGWSDIGSWNAISSLVASDGDGNVLEGEGLLHDVSNCYIRSNERIIGVLGVSDLFIIDTPDALLVADKTRGEDVKQLYSQLKAQGHETHKVHRTVHRPWGTYTVLEEGVCFKIKRIVVKPGASLSLQMHHHRSEHWVVVSGAARVTNGDKEFMVHVNQSTYIPAGNQHRLENPGVLDLVMIEVQSGEYLGEDDIVRFEDVYGRV